MSGKKLTRHRVAALCCGDIFLQQGPRICLELTGRWTKLNKGKSKRKPTNAIRLL